MNPTKRSAEYQSHRKWQRGEIREFIRLLKQFPCEDCGQVYPFYVMQFDHRDGKTKRTNVTAGTESWSYVLRELLKCDLVCANCHLKREWSRRCVDVNDQYNSRITTTFRNSEGLVSTTASNWVDLFHTAKASKQWLTKERADDIVALIQKIANRNTKRL